MRRANMAAKTGKAAPRRAGRYTLTLVATSSIVLLAGMGVAVARTRASVPEGSAQTEVARPVPQPIAPPTTGEARASKPRTKTVPTTTSPPVPKVVSVSPANGATGVALGQHIVVKLSHLAAVGAPMPVLKPAVAGQWWAEGDSLVFTPATGYTPWATEQLSIPATLATGKPSHFSVAGVALLRVQQVLAELGYLPLDFTDNPAEFLLDNEPSNAALVPGTPQPGTFVWPEANVPPELSSLWTKGQYNVITQGAIMHFESVEGLTVDGLEGPKMWAALKVAVAGRQYDPVPYDYLMVTETLPETLVVWQDGSYVYGTPANTGVPGATTQPGTFPVYLRFESTTMQGTDPDGTKYDIAGVPWVAYFNGGDAVHGFWRYSYGWPQSNGCVELPVDNAQVVWGMDPIGTLVTVTTGPLPANS